MVIHVMVMLEYRGRAWLAVEDCEGGEAGAVSTMSFHRFKAWGWEMERGNKMDSLL